MKNSLIGTAGDPRSSTTKSKSQQRYLNSSSNNVANTNLSGIEDFNLKKLNIKGSSNNDFLEKELQKQSHLPQLRFQQQQDDNSGFKNLFNNPRKSNRGTSETNNFNNQGRFNSNIKEPNSGLMSSQRKKLQSMDFGMHNLQANNQFSKPAIQERLDRYKNKNKKQQITRESLVDFISSEYGFNMSQMQATDAILFCRGPGLDNSAVYQEEKLVSWLENILPTLRKIQDRFKPFPARKTVPNSLNTSQDNLYISKIVNNNNTGRQFSNTDQYIENMHQKQNKFQINPMLVKEMNDCLAQCEKQPSLKRKIQDTLYTLQESMMDYKAQEGLKASMRAQKRLRDKINYEEESKEKSIQRMLEQTAVLDSPIRAANLQEVLRKQWCEYRDSYVIMSKLTQQQKKKLNDMIFNRYNDI
eukprot:403339970